MNNAQIKCIHVGLGNFSINRLKINLRGGYFKTVAFVDKDIKKMLSKLKFLEGIPEDYEQRSFASISEAVHSFKAEACFIYVSSDSHSNLVIESLNNNLHTLCVKSIACNLKEFKKILEAKKKNMNLLLIQGLNNQWSNASKGMQKLLNDKSKFGDFVTGYGICWGRQNLKMEKLSVDSTSDGIFFHSMGCHQLGQLVSALGLPKKVRCISPIQEDEEIGFINVNRTAGGNCLLEYKNNAVFSYIGTRAAHCNPFGFAARWSGSWMFHGTKGDIKREGGRISLYQKNNMIQDEYLEDLDNGLIKNDEMQFKQFYQDILNDSHNSELQKKSLQTWVLMEAINISSRENREVIIKDFIEEMDSNEVFGIE